MSHIYCLVLLTLAAGIQLRGVEENNMHQVLKPPGSKDGLEEALLVMIPGANVDTSYYIEPMK